MSREKMLQAEIALKDEQLADLNASVERLRRQLEESEKRRIIADQSESKIAELKQTIGKLAPVAKKAILFAGELDEARRSLAIAEKERNELSNDYSTIARAIDGTRKARSSKRKATPAVAKRSEKIRRGER